MEKNERISEIDKNECFIALITKIIDDGMITIILGNYVFFISSDPNNFKEKMNGWMSFIKSFSSVFIENDEKLKETNAASFLLRSFNN